MEIAQAIHEIGYHGNKICPDERPADGQPENIGLMPSPTWSGGARIIKQVVKKLKLRKASSPAIFTPRGCEWIRPILTPSNT